MTSSVSKMICPLVRPYARSADDRLTKRGLARTVGADEREHFALLHVEVDRIHRAIFTKRF